MYVYTVAYYCYNYCYIIIIIIIVIINSSGIIIIIIVSFIIRPSPWEL